MFIANTLRSENIAEYILYMWQIEDTLRAYQFSIARLKDEYVERFNYNESQKEQEIDWLAGMITMMNKEAKRDKGHLKINEEIVTKLETLHKNLLNDSESSSYSTVYYKTLPYIVELRGKGISRNLGEIETCLNALYGIILLRLQGKEIASSTKYAIDSITKLLALLSKEYKKTYISNTKTERKKD